MAKPISLGVNIDHVATLRNARGGGHPDPLTVAKALVGTGMDGITIHLREDRRHIRDADAEAICAWAGKPVNFEMAATEEMVAIAMRLRPHGCCVVPEKRAEITTEGGLDVVNNRATLKPAIARLKEAGIRVSLFVDPEAAQVEASAEIGAEVVELHTGAYANGKRGELERLRRAAELTAKVGLECHAGHGLTFANVSPIAAFPEVVELNIGHFLMGEALLIGLPAAIAEMKRLMIEARVYLKS
ncbi:pyridoxine 5'-phosphate synthase [Acidocella sp.]|uniref:pyridoxine 5'-phosphate synthase n=1 Tax=Acidocella sp. TaxID=50710 RepID=UPI002619D57D|nr:pyridoxine 5'-phosphate synthase [Acidocella sp.]